MYMTSNIKTYLQLLHSLQLRFVAFKTSSYTEFLKFFDIYSLFIIHIHINICTYICTYIHASCIANYIYFFYSFYTEMVEAMKKVASMDVELTVEERNLLSVAYKNVIGARRASWRIITSIEQKEENKGAEEKLEMIKTYRGQVEKELRDICSDILNVLEKHLIPCATTGESKVFYYKMKGDYHRYLAEFATGSDRKDAAENSLIAYKAASDIAMNDLPPTHPIRLGLALNFSVSDCLILVGLDDQKIFFY